MKTILAVDPGREKCGLAVANSAEVLHKEVVLRADVVRAVVSLADTYSVDEVIIGNGTGSGKVIEEIHGAVTTLVLTVEEAYTSQRARSRFFEENPPRGIRRLIPRGLLTPDRPYDDYVAVILAEDYLLQPSI